MILGAGALGCSPYASGGSITTPPPPAPPRVATILDYYAALLIIQYRTLPNANRTVRLMANQSVCGGFLFEEQVCFGIDVAVGEQLDVLGRIVGVSRQVYTFDPNRVFFNFTDYFDTPEIVAGFGDYTDSPYDPNGYMFFSYNQFNNISLTLSDEDMRTLIKMKIQLNNSRATFAFIKQYVYDWFDDIEVEDNLDMSITYTIAASFSNLARAALYLRMLPAPTGVKPNYVFQ